MIENPKRIDPRADLHRSRAALHRAERSRTDSEALREDRHGVVACETQRLKPQPKLSQTFLRFFNIYQSEH